MTRETLDDALQQVRDIRMHMLENRMFRGYSGAARIVSGVLALLGAIILSRPAFPQNLWNHFGIWGAVCAIAMLLNYGLLVIWAVKKHRAQANWSSLRPAWDAISPLALGAALTLHRAHRGQFDSLFGVWMALFGLMHLNQRHSLPPPIEHLGWFYLLCGITLLLRPVSFMNPWPMGLVFFAGELVGGLVFVSHNFPERKAREVPHE